MLTLFFKPCAFADSVWCIFLLHFTSEYAKEALELINGLVVEGRQLRVDVKARVAKEEGVERKVSNM
jgi:hypothetical protein